jgi:Protein of unknown function (DUF1579)
MTINEQLQSEPQDAPEQAAPAPPPEARQFDFWIGEWDLTWEGGGTGTDVVRATLDDFVIVQEFDGSNPSLRGMSVSAYDARRGKWQQTWVDNQGSYLTLFGGMQDGKMVLAMERELDGKQLIYRMVYYNIAGDHFDWDWERSEDAGHAWELLWRIHYQRKQSK